MHIWSGYSWDSSLSLIIIDILTQQTRRGKINIYFLIKKNSLLITAALSIFPTIFIFRCIYHLFAPQNFLLHILLVAFPFHIKLPFSKPPLSLSVSAFSLYKYPELYVYIPISYIFCAIILFDLGKLILRLLYSIFYIKDQSFEPLNNYFRWIVPRFQFLWFC